MRWAPLEAPGGTPEPQFNPTEHRSEEEVLPPELTPD